MSSLQTKAILCATGLVIFVCDLLVRADLNVAIFYCFVVALFAWTRSSRLLWIATAAFLPATFLGLVASPPSPEGLAWWEWCNRGFTVAAILLVSWVTYKRMRLIQALERTTAAHKRAEDELRDKEAMLRMAQQAGNIGSWGWDPLTGTYFFSDECYRMLGLASDSTFQAKWMDRVNPDDLSKIQEAMEQCGTGQSFKAEYRYQHPTNGFRWIQICAKMLARDSGGPRLFGTSQDITERKEAEDFMAKTRSSLELLVDQRTTQLKSLSLALMHLQDEEHRRIARELHDSFGQYLASLKINLDRLFLAQSGSSAQLNAEQVLADSLEVVEHCIIETRTLSYLLHPPLLDEAGFGSAARCI